MSARDFRTLPSPPLPPHQNDDETWDSTFQPSASNSHATSWCSVATSAHTIVFGIKEMETRDNSANVETNDDNDNNNSSSHHPSTTSQISSIEYTWQTCLSQHSSSAVGGIVSLTCNPSQTVLAVSTESGVLALLRSVDGDVLATRRLCDDATVDMTLVWMSDTMLLVEKGATQQWIAVQNIQGHVLNSENSSLVAETVQRMHIVPLPPLDVRAVTGLVVGNHNTLRLVTCESDGCVAVRDHPHEATGGGWERVPFSFGSTEEQRQEPVYDIDFHVGLQKTVLYHSNDDNKTFVIWSAYSVETSCSKIVWMDPNACTIACEYVLPHSKVLALQPLSNVSEQYSSVVVAVKKEADVFFEILQVLVDETLGLTTLSRPHPVFNIPLNSDSPAVRSISLTMITSRLYGFRCHIWSNTASNESTETSGSTYKEFVPDETTATAVGNLCQLLAREQFDEAQAALDSMEASVANFFHHPDSFAAFHPSEMALRRFQHAMAQGNVVLAQDSLQELAKGASAVGKGRELFLEGISIFLQSTNLPIEYFLAGLKGIASLLNAIKAQASEESRNQLTVEYEALLRRANTIEYLTSLDSIPTLSTSFHSIRSTTHLFRVLINDKQFVAAERLFRSNLRGDLSVEAMLLPMTNIGSDVAPKEYIPLLCDVIFPLLTVSSGSLPRLKGWVYRLADELDDMNQENMDLTAAIELLTVVEKGLRTMTASVHASFGSYSPFVEHVEKRRPGPKGVNSSDISNSSPIAASKRVGATVQKVTERPIPTILELGALTSGASTSGRRLGGNDEEFLVEEDCVKDKLNDAECLRDARNLGLERRSVFLRDFQKNGGATFVARELVGLYASLQEHHEDRVRDFSDKIVPFLKKHAIDNDKVLVQCVENLCRGKNVSEKRLDEACSIVRNCVAAHQKCKASLIVLRSALLCGSTHFSLMQLSKDAIAWAHFDSSVQSELQEASRLLQIDAIVTKYCGFGARELFRVDNPLHALRLLKFVAVHVEHKDVIDDSLQLCDAFHHLSSGDAVRLILQTALLHSDSELAVELLQSLIDIDVSLAETALTGAVVYTQNILRQCSKAVRSSCPFDRVTKLRSDARVACQRAGNLIVLAMEHCLNLSKASVAELYCFLDTDALSALRDVFLRIQRLQTDHSVYLSLAELHETRHGLEAVSHFMAEVAESDDESSINARLAAAKRVCSLVAGQSLEEKDLWGAAAANVVRQAIREGRTRTRVLYLLDKLGLLNSQQNDVVSRLHLSLSLSICQETTKGQSDARTGMKKAVEALSLLQDWLIANCSGRTLVASLTLAGQLDIVYHVFSRCDEAKGDEIEFRRRQFQSSSWGGFFRGPISESNISGDTVEEHKFPALHASWYVGDGLLLPPDAALLACYKFFEASFGGTLSSQVTGLFEILDECGAHSLALRVLCESSATRSCVSRSQDDGDITFSDIPEVFEKTVFSLAERSLGGSGSGITSAVIDCEQAACFLLSLPMKQSFSLYKACLPTAMKSRNFDRLYNLSIVGMVVSSSKSLLGAGCLFSVGWGRQKKFFDQCHQLAAKSKWWIVLDKYGVDFDCVKFQDSRAKDQVLQSNETASQTSQESHYCALLITEIITKSSTYLRSDNVLRLMSLYASSFFLSQDLIRQRHVEFVLKSPGIDQERTARSTLKLLSSAKKRAMVLRRCLLNLQKNKSAGQQYELYNLVLSLYQESLNQAFEWGKTIQGVSNTDLSNLEAELDAVDRRRDALSILLAYFRKDRRSERPDLGQLFLPFSNNLGRFEDDGCESTGSLLGSPPTADTECFDPLKPLEAVFAASIDGAAVTALAPLRFPVGLPQGYIHVRSLVARFRAGCAEKANLPSFDSDVLPCLNRLRLPSDQVELAEWCAAQYQNNDAEKLQCLSFASQASIKASTEIEQRRIRYPTDLKLKQQEQNALDKIKSLSRDKESLSHKLRVSSILSSDPTRHRNVQALLDGLVADLENCARQSPANGSPEFLIDQLLTQGSLIAANESLDGRFPISHFRSFSGAIHTACQHIAEEHSHVDPRHRARRFAQRWLFHGDDEVRDSEVEISIEAPAVHGPTKATDLPMIEEEDDTVDFVMDLSELQASVEGMGSDLARATPSTDSDKMISVAEASALQDTSPREKSENAARRAGLRIAFVLSFAGGPSSLEEESGEENTDQQKDNQKRFSLLKTLRTKKDTQSDGVFEHGSELMSVVFAKSRKKVSLFNSYTSFDSNASTYMSERDKPRSVTFAMRHRALRAASVLCPQEALEKIVRDEGYLQSLHGEEKCSLRQCTFGAFLAKEIEELGLTLPHSDLIQLSSMQFLSYARTLWRQHRSDNANGRERGRMLLLLLEMSLMSIDLDEAFTCTLVSEMVRLKLPRTLLQALECLFKSKKLKTTLLISDPIFQTAMKAVAETIFSEAYGVKNRDNVSGAEATLARLFDLCVKFSDLMNEDELLVAFSRHISALVEGPLPTLSDLALQTSAKLERQERKRTVQR